MCKYLSLIAVGVLLVFGGLFATVWVGVRHLTYFMFKNDEFRTYESWEDVEDDKLLVQLIPRSATNIKRRDFGGFKSYQCDVSCHVSLRGLQEFAKERGYYFERIDFDDAVRLDMFDSEGRVEVGSLSGIALLKDEFLSCSFWVKSQDGLTRCFLFLYDKVYSKLYCRYSDG